MAKLTTKQRSRMKPSCFAYPERRLLPVQDAGHLHSSLGRFAQITYPDLATQKRVARRIARAAKKLGIPLDPAGAVARMATGDRIGQRTAGKSGSGRARSSRRNPDVARTDREGLRKAIKLSKDFHGVPTEVLELSERERRLPKYVTLVGDVEDMTYQPQAGKRSGGTPWKHKSGEGIFPFLPRSKGRPLLVADPTTGRPALVTGKSRMRMTKDGLVG